MKEFFKNYTLGSLVCCAIGAALLINPHIITDVLNTAIGIILIVWGVFGAAKCLSGHSASDDGDINIFSLLGSIALIGGGVYVFRHTDLLEKVLMAVLGVYLICSGLPKLIDSLNIRKELGEKWKKPLVTSVITVILGIVVLIIPALLPNLVMRLLGGLLLAGGIGNFIGGHSSSRVLRGIREEHEYKRGKPAAPTGKIVDIESFSEK